MPDATSERRTDQLLVGVAALLTLYVAATLRSALLATNVDLNAFILPWWNHILHFGRLRSLEASFANYTPPYVYLLDLATLGTGLLPPVVWIKLISIAFLVPAAYLAGSLCRALGGTPRRAWLTAWIVAMAPEVMWNVVRWGQSDIIYTTFVLLFIRLCWARRPGWAMAALGIAFSFKLQTIFLGPVVLALLIAGELPLRSLLSTALAWVVMMLPAALAGRPVRALLLIFGNQTNTYPTLSLDAPNLWAFVSHWTDHSPRLTNIGGLVALALAGTATVALVAYLVRSRQLAQRNVFLMAAAFSLLMEPFLLPRMHDRYFFPGNVLVLVLAVTYPRRFGVAAILLQTGACIAYSIFLANRLPWVGYTVPAACLVAAGVVIVWSQLQQAAL